MPVLPPSRALLCLVLTGALAAQSANDLLVADYQKRRDAELFAMGQRHLTLGCDLRETGLVEQGTYQLLRAVELSEGKNQGAHTVLGIVRGLGEAFWAKGRKVPSKHALVSYEKRAAAAERENVKGHVKLAKLAQKARLNGRMTEHWLAALRLGAKVEVGKEGARIEGESLPAEFVEWLRGQTTQVNEGKCRFEPAGAAAPRVADVREVADERLVVRTDLPSDVALRLHALGRAEWPLLCERLGSSPVRPLGLFVFSKRADYEEYLKACGHGGALGGAGLCDYGTFQTLVCAEGRSMEDTEALVLHELAHLFFFGSAPVAMPDWYAEGFAESFGGQGSFAWDGKTLTIGGMMRRDRIDAMKRERFALRELLAGDAELLLRTDHGNGMRFYTQCWALQRFVLEPGNEWRDRFLAWEAECRGAMPGASSTMKLGDEGPALAAFQRTFGTELAALEAAFSAWLDEL